MSPIRPDPAKACENCTYDNETLMCERCGPNHDMFKQKETSKAARILVYGKPTGIIIKDIFDLPDERDDDPEPREEGRLLIEDWEMIKSPPHLMFKCKKCGMVLSFARSHDCKKQERNDKNVTDCIFFETVDLGVGTTSFCHVLKQESPNCNGCTTYEPPVTVELTKLQKEREEMVKKKDDEDIPPNSFASNKAGAHAGNPVMSGNSRLANASGHDRPRSGKGHPVIDMEGKMKTIDSDLDWAARSCIDSLKNNIDEIIECGDGEPLKCQNCGNDEDFGVFISKFYLTLEKGKKIKSLYLEYQGIITKPDTIIIICSKCDKVVVETSV